MSPEKLFTALLNDSTGVYAGEEPLYELVSVVWEGKLMCDSEQIKKMTRLISPLRLV